MGESIFVRIYIWDQFVKMDARGFGGMKRGKLCSSRDAETMWMAGSLRSKEVGNQKRDELVPFEPVGNAAQGYLKLVIVRGKITVNSGRESHHINIPHYSRCNWAAHEYCSSLLYRLALESIAVSVTTAGETSEAIRFSTFQVKL